MAEPTVEELQLRLARLEEENTALRAGISPATLSPTSPRGHRRSYGWWRAPVATLLIVLGTLVAPVALVAAWANVQLTDTDRFVATYAPLAEDPALQSAISAQVVDVIERQVDIPTLTGDVIDGVIDLGTGPAATRALELLKGPTAQGLQTLMATLVDRFVTSEAFANVWAAALRISHSQLVAALQDDPDAAIALGADGTIGIQLGPIVDAVKDALEEQGVGFAASIPTVDRTIAIARFDSLGSVRLGYELVLAAGLWLPWVAVLLLATAVLTARRRWVALVAAALSLGGMMLILLAALSVGRMLFDAALRINGAPADAGGAIYELVVGAMRDTAAAVVVLALVTASVGWFTGPSSVPRRLRGAVHAGMASVRASLERRGLSSGRVGVWLYARRTLLRVIIALGSAAIVLLVRPLTPALVLWTLALSVLAVLILEVIERPPRDDRGAQGSADVTSSDAAVDAVGEPAS